MFTPSFLPTVGGVELAVHHLASAMLDLGHDVTVLTFWKSGLDKGSSPYTVRTLLPGVARFRGKTAFVQEYAIAVSLAMLWIRWRYDVLNVHMAYPGGIAAAMLRRVIKVPTVITCHAADVQLHPELSYGMRLEPGVEAKIICGLEMAEATTAVSTAVAGDVSEMCPNIEAAHVVPNGVVHDRFRTSPGSMRQDLGIGLDHKIILAVGRNHPKKGYGNLVEAVALLSQKRHDFKCVIVGRDTGSLLPAIKHAGLEGTIVMPGQFPREGMANLTPSSIPPDDLVSLYLESDIFVSPSLLEGFALVLPEAMAAGLPIVATRIAGNEDIVIDGENGMLVPAGDVSALAASLDTILSDDKMRARMSECARATSAQYDWPRIARSYISVYNKAISTRTPPR